MIEQSPKFSQFINYFTDYVKTSWQNGGSGTTRSGRTAGNHPMTGAFEKSLEWKVLKNPNSVSVEIWGNLYGKVLSEGVRANRIPYTPKPRGKGVGGKSKYIQGLYSWVKQRLGIQDPQALSITFAIAKSHAKYGMPERNGQLGTNWLIPDSNEESIYRKAEDGFIELIEESFDQLWEKIE